MIFADVAVGENEAWARTLALLIGGLVGAGGLLQLWSRAIIKRWEENETAKRTAILSAETSKREEELADKQALAQAQTALTDFLKGEIESSKKMNEATIQNIQALTTAVQNSNVAVNLMQETLHGTTSKICKFKRTVTKKI